MSSTNQSTTIANRLEAPFLFLKRSISNFRQIGSIYPSSSHVGRMMAQTIADRPARHVVELGAGTGPVTAQLLLNGVARNELTALEIDPLLCHHLRAAFPGLDVIDGLAQTLSDLWTERNGPPVGGIVSTLPLRLLDDATIFAIMRSAFDIMEPGGKFVQLTYRPSSPAPKRICAELGLISTRFQLILLNLPPAIIWIYRKP
jgi:phosphatidylethanolamine/phosphatidyl-N-methylethanolamine N-methyltransferase